MFKDSFWGTSGFEELRKYIKHCNEFSRDVATVMAERSELESNYAKALSKLSSKLTKATNGCLGTLASAWGMVATEMEAEADLHRSLAQALAEDIHKPMKNLADTQHKTRKPIELTVDKAIKTLADRRSDESKAKKLAFTCAKEREKMCDQLQNARGGRGKLTSDKDVAKMEKKVRQLEESVKRSDREYHESCQKAESARQEWETCVFKASGQLQTLEEERISQMQDFMNKYNSHLSVVGPKLVRGCERLGEAVISIDVNADLRTVIDQKGTGPNQPEQLLLDYYAEDFGNNMDRERRRQLLQNYLIYLQQDIEREIKGKEGVEKLMEVYQNRPNFADAEAQEDARQRLAHVNATLNFLEACHHKIATASASLEGRGPPSSKFSQYIEKTKDKQGQTVSTLRLPMSMVMDGYGPDPGGAYSRGPADGGHGDASYVKAKLQETSNACQNDDDEFDSYEPSPTIMGQCRAIYDYAACQYDELTIKPGDIIKIFDKQEDGWWQGELNGRIGIFPATYVEEIRGPP